MIRDIKITDFHAHILPGADHGSSGTDVTRRQLALMNNAGVDTVVATPHFYPNRHTLEYFLDKVALSAEEFTSIDIQRPRLCIGAEVLYCEGLENLENIDRLCIRGTNILLLELPLDPWDQWVLYTVDKLLKKYTVMLAHIDRYITRQAPEIEQLLDMGALAQINASSLFYFSEKKHLSPFIERGMISAIGSDLHEVNKKTYKHFSSVEKKLGDEYLKIMERSQELLKDAEKI